MTSKLINQKPLLVKSHKLMKKFRIIDKNRYYSNFGPYYYVLKKKIENALKLKKSSITFTSSGYSSLHACCKLIANRNKKKIVLVPTYSFAANPQSIISSGLEPFFVDINKDSYEMDYEDASKILKKYRKKIAAIMIVSPFGYPINIKKYLNIFSKYKVPIIYDAVDTLLNHRSLIESDNVYYTHSFHPTKIIPSNESGMIIASKKKEKFLKSMINFGMIGETRSINLYGFNGKFTEYDAAILDSNFEEIKKIKKRLIKINHHIITNVKNESLIFQKNFGVNWFSLRLVLRHKFKNFNSIFSKLKKEGIIISHPWHNKFMHQYSIFKKYKKSNLSNSQALQNKIFSINMRIDIKKKDLDFLVKNLNEI